MGGGAGSGGGAGGEGAGQGDQQGAGGANGGQGPNGGGKGAGSCGPGSGGGCPNPVHGGAGTAAGDPVDVLTGVVYTIPEPDLILPGPIPLALRRSYSTLDADEDIGLGFGWKHSLVWVVEPRRRRVRVVQPHGPAVLVPLPEVGASVDLPFGTLLRLATGYTIDARDGLLRSLVALPGHPERFVLTRISDTHDNAVRLEYDASGALVRILDAVGREVRVRREAGRIVAFEAQADPEGRRTAVFRRYAYSEAGDLIAATSALGGTQAFAYDDDHRLVSRAEAGGLRVHFRYDRAGRCCETWCTRDRGDDGLDEGVPGDLTDGTPARGFLHARIVFGDGYAEVSTSRGLRRYEGSGFGHAPFTGWAGDAHTKVFGPRGELLRYADGGGAASSWSYDAGGRLTRFTDPAGGGVEYELDARGAVTAVTDALGQACTFVRDPRGDLLEMRDALGLVAAFGYDTRGLVVEGRLPNGGVTRMEHDAHGARRRIVEPDGSERLFDDDFLGRIRAMRDEHGRAWQYTYDPMGRLSGMITPSGARWAWEYDDDGLLARIVDGDGRATTLEWGGYHVVTAVCRPDGRRVRYRYDREQDLVAVVNEQGEVHRFERDGAGRILAEHTFDGRVRSFKHDHQGRVVALRHADHSVTKLRYDPVGRLVEREHEDGSKEEYEYDGIGRLVQARTANAVTTFSYDPRGNVLREQTRFGGETFAVDASFDACGRAVRAARSTGEVVEVERDVLGRPVTVRFDGQVLSQRSFGPGGFETMRLLPSGGRIAREMTPEGLLGRVAVEQPGRAGPRPGEPDWIGDKGDLSLLRRYRWSAGDYLAGIETNRDIEIIRDADARVVELRERGQAIEAYAYSPSGDPYPKSASGGGRAYGPGGRVERFGATERAYDGRGRLVLERTHDGGVTRERRLSWGDDDLLREVEDHDGTLLRFAYDAFGRRLEKRVERGGRVVYRARFRWHGDVLVGERRERLGSDGQLEVTEVTYVHVPGELLPLAHRTRSGGEDGPWGHYVYTPNGFVDALVDDAGRVVGTLDADLFGRVDEARGRLTPLRAPGQYFDEESGLVYNHFRYYDPANGLYISPEPLGLEGSLCPYAYASSRPLDMVDVTGLDERMWTRITRNDGSCVYGHSQGRQSGDLHPAVQAALPRQNARGPNSNTNPNACAEPHALSNHLHDYESRPPGLPERSCRPGDPGWRRNLASAMNEISPNDGIESRYGPGDRARPADSFDNNAGNERAACPNCSQTVPRLFHIAGVPAPGQVLAPGQRADGTGPFRTTPAAPGYHRTENARASEIAGMNPQPWVPNAGTYDYSEGAQRWRRRY